ncbi:hypothetical protein [Methylomonas koyamae]|nr:hypothetical protein [Methylomonas koyamae]
MAMLKKVVDLPTGHNGHIPVFTSMQGKACIQMIGEVMSNMEFKVSSDANDAPPCVGSILSAHLMGFKDKSVRRNDLR